MSVVTGPRRGRKQDLELTAPSNWRSWPSSIIGFGSVRQAAKRAANASSQALLSSSSIGNSKGNSSVDFIKDSECGVKTSCAASSRLRRRQSLIEIREEVGRFLQPRRYPQQVLRRLRSGPFDRGPM